MTEDQLALVKIFLPHALRQMTRVRENNIRFAHYTSADTALKILRSQRMLLRNSSLMNDFSEIHHGLECLENAYNSPLGDRLNEALRAVQDNLPEVLQRNFRAQILGFSNETYLMSVSEHGDGGSDERGEGHENSFGRLSMWRAYAPKDGVAFIMKNQPFLCESNALNAFSSPVVYAMPNEFQYSFEEVVIAIEDNIETIKKYGGEIVHQLLLTAFRFSVQSTKHPSFKEERGWRVIYSPSILHREGGLNDRQMARIPTEIMSIGGVPQRVFAIPFVDYPDEGFVGATAPALIDRILVGPSRDSRAIQHALIAELMLINVAEPESKVVITGVPLRH